MVATRALSVSIRRSGCVSACLLVALLGSAIPASAGAPKPPIVFLGSFYSEIQGNEYVYQDQIDLWSQGAKVFGLTASSTGMTVFNRFEGTLDERPGSLYLSGFLGSLVGFRGTLKDSVMIGAAWSDAPLQYKLAQDPIGSHASQAPTASYENWRAWADSLIDDAEARSPSTQRDIQECHGGDTWACLNIGNGLKYRKPEEARRYWKIACDGGSWPGCKFLGEQDRYMAILHNLCDTSHKPSLERNMACQELGTVAEKAARIDEAVHWYKIGCNEYSLPTTCCRRLEALQRAGQKDRHIKPER